MEQEKIDQATALFKEKLTAWFNDKEKDKSAYEFEKSYMEAVQKIEQEVLQIMVGTKAKSRNAKKKSKPWQEK